MRKSKLQELQKAKYRREEAKAKEKNERKEFSKMKAHLFAEEQKAEEKAKNLRFQKRVRAGEINMVENKSKTIFSIPVKEQLHFKVKFAALAVNVCYIVSYYCFLHAKR